MSCPAVQLLGMLSQLMVLDVPEEAEARPVIVGMLGHSHILDEWDGGH